MKTLLAKRIAVGCVFVLVTIQFVRPAKNITLTGPGPNDITVLHPTSPEVTAILAKACYDCHSDHTRYPWYAEVQPVGWWLADHVKEGKHELNFSEFGAYAPGRAVRKLKGIDRMLQKHQMPLASYTLLHRDAVLTADESDALIKWADALRASIPVAN
ncbi:MAG TPA: heme-binding domain-containing protein [Opitutus sp.]|nr:heme-binding domain-containing protein [Opitutus sp.]